MFFSRSKKFFFVLISFCIVILGSFFFTPTSFTDPWMEEGGELSLAEFSLQAAFQEEEPIQYKKGDVKTKFIVPTGKLVGEGWGSKVLEYKADPEKFVVKKSIWPLEEEFRVGKRLNHENIVKVKALFIKEVPLTMSTIYKLMLDPKWRNFSFDWNWKECSFWSFLIKKFSGKPLFLYKMMMERIHGKTLNTYFGKSLDPSIVKSLLVQARETGLYLFDQKTQMQAIHGENIMVCDNSYKLMIVDLGHWTLEENPEVRGLGLLQGIQRLMFNIVSTSSLSNQGIEKGLSQINSTIPNLSCQDALPTRYTESVVGTDLKENHFIGKSEPEIRSILEDYCNSVIDRFSGLVI